MPFIAACVIFVVLVIGEILWRKNLMHGEVSRKAVHLIVGSFIATWPFFMSFRDIRLLCLAMLLVITISKATKLFPSVHDVSRRTLGELFFPLGIGAVAFMTTSPWVFMAAVLHLSIADGLAGVVGTLYRRKHKGYLVLGQVKTVAGTLAFLAGSILVTTFVMAASIGVVVWPLVFALAISAAILENVALYGSDNLLVPVLVVLVLNSM